MTKGTFKREKTKLILLGLQHTFTMFASTILVPKMLGLNISVAIFMAGVETLIFHAFTKGKVPVFLGSSFEYMPPLIIAASLYGMEYALGGVVLCGLAYLLVSILVYFLGADKITNIFPPVITGSISIALGLSLASHAIGLASSNWLLAVITLLIIVIINVYCKGFTKLLSIIISLILVYLLSIILTTVNIATLVDFSQVNKAAWFGIPQFTVAKFNVESFMLVLPYAICAIVDHIGDVIVVGAVCDKNFVKEPGIHRTLIGDGVAMSFSALLGGPPNATYSENIGVLALTQNFNPKTIRIAALFAIVLGFVPKLSALISVIPDGIIGGISIMLFGTISSMGVNQFVDNKVDFKNAKNIIIVTLILILSIGGASVNFSIGNVKVVVEGLGLAAIVGVVLNLILPNKQ